MERVRRRRIYRRPLGGRLSRWERGRGNSTRADPTEVLSVRPERWSSSRYLGGRLNQCTDYLGGGPTSARINPQRSLSPEPID